MTSILRAHDVGQDAIEDRVGRERPHGAPPNVAVNSGEGAGRLGDELERSPHLKEEAERRAGIARVLAVPARCFVEVALCGSADFVLHAD